jgi:hypothetical protein
MSAIETTQVAFFRHRGAIGENVSLSMMLDGIKRGSWAGQVKRLRSIGRDAEGYDKRKAALPAFMLSGTTTSGHKAADVAEHSGLLQIDVDKVGVDKVESLRDRIGEDRHMLASWVSPSGDGVKGIMLVPADIARHKAAFEAAAEYMKENYGVSIDSACSNVNRLCYVSHDREMALNAEAEPLEVPPVGAEAPEGSEKGYSSTSLHSISCILHLHNSGLFDDFPHLRPLYQKLVAHRCGKPQRGMRNQAMVEIVAACFCAVALEFVKGFAVEYFKQHADVFADYDFATYQHEVESMLAGCLRDYPQRLSESERHAYAALACEREQAAFRIAQSLSKCESEASMPPPLFFLSCAGLGTRLGIMDTPAWRILRAFEKSGFIQMERPGTVRTKGVQGIATVYRWML